MAELPSLLPIITSVPQLQALETSESVELHQIRMNIVDLLRSRTDIDWDENTINIISHIIINKAIYNVTYDPYIESLIPVTLNLIIT